MWVKPLLPQSVIPSRFSTAPGVKNEDYDEESLWLLRAGTGNIAGSSGKPIPIGPFPLVASGGVTTDRAFWICIQIVVVGLDVILRRLGPEIVGPHFWKKLSSPHSPLHYRRPHVGYPAFSDLSAIHWFKVLPFRRAPT
jgi:hypothetical protein